MTLDTYLHCLPPNQLAAFAKLQVELPEITRQAQYAEMYGYHLMPDTKAPGRSFNETYRDVILLKFLAAVDYDAPKAMAALSKSLEWRKQFKPLDCIHESHSPVLDKFGFITAVGPVGQAQVTVWHRIGAITTDPFKEVSKEAYMRWKVGLLERGLGDLDFSEPGSLSKFTFVEDFKGANFEDQDRMKFMTEDIALHGYYVGLRERSIFVNLPLVMRLGMKFMKVFAFSKETGARVEVVAKGKDLHKLLGSWVPPEYGGGGAEPTRRKGSSISAAIPPAIRSRSGSEKLGAAGPSSGAAGSESGGSSYPNEKAAYSQEPSYHRGGYGPTEDDDAPPAYEG